MIPTATRRRILNNQSGSVLSTYAYRHAVHCSNTRANEAQSYTLLTPPFITQHGQPSSRSAVIVYRSKFIAINTLLFLHCLFAHGACWVNRQSRIHHSHTVLQLCALETLLTTSALKQSICDKDEIQQNVILNMPLPLSKILCSTKLL